MKLTGVRIFSPLQRIITKETPPTKAPKLQKPPRRFGSPFREKLPGEGRTTPRPVPGYPPGADTPGPGRGRMLGAGGGSAKDGASLRVGGMRPLSHSYQSLRNRPRRIVFISKRSVPPACYPPPCLCCLVGFLHPPRLISEFLQQSPAEPAPSPGARPRRCPHKSQLCAATAGTSRGKRPGRQRGPQPPPQQRPHRLPTTAEPLRQHPRGSAPPCSPRLLTVRFPGQLLHNFRL